MKNILYHASVLEILLRVFLEARKVLGGSFS
jgi:hypothetical protein